MWAARLGYARAMLRTLTVIAAAAALAAVLAATGAAATPSRSLASAYAHRTFVVDPQLGDRSFALEGPSHTVHASDGSSITAFGIVIADSGDGSGQAVLLFRGGHFLGWASAFDTLHLSVSASGSAIDVKYGVYKGNDPSCCPSSIKTIAYRWTGGRIVASGTPPLIYGRQGSRLHLRP